MNNLPPTGAEVLLRTLVAGGIEVCFMNPGTSEMQFVTALDQVPGLRGILCLFEGVCSGAADGYARMAGRPAATLLHLGPGLANGLANFHNARKARSGIVNIVGEHATHHMTYDAPLTADIEAIARPFSAWVRTVPAPDAITGLVSEAIGTAATPPGSVATIIVPADFSWSPASMDSDVVPLKGVRRPCDPKLLDQAEILLRQGPETALLLSGSSLRADSLRQAARIARATGSRVYLNRYAGRFARGRGVPAHPRIPYFPEHAEALLSGLKHILMIETEQPPVSFFGYPGRRSTVAPLDCECHRFVLEPEDGSAALDELVQRLNAAPYTGVPADLPAIDEGPLTPDYIGRALAHLLPDGAILSDEMVSASEFVSCHLTSAANHETLPVTGGSIGQGLPVALGAAIACPNRKVICLEADGSGMYTLQALWTMARERLDVTTVIFANRRYRILDVEIERTNSRRPGPLADAMLDLHQPELDWTRLAESQGVPASRVHTGAEFFSRFRQAMKAPGPHLIEAVIP